MTQIRSKSKIKALPWVVAMPLIAQLIGLIRTGYIARELAPSSYHAVAIFVLLTSTAIALSQIGTRFYLMQKLDLTNRDLDTAWTLEVVKGALVSICLLSASKLIANYSESADIAMTVTLATAAIFFSSTTSSRQVKFEREYKIKQNATLLLINSLLDVSLCAIALSIETSAMSALFGLTSAQAAKSIYSHMHYRAIPRLLIDAVLAREILCRYAYPVFMSTSLSYLSTQLDQLLITSSLDNKDLSGYQIAALAASIPMIALASPISSILFPALCRVRDNKLLFNKMGTDAIIATTIISFSLFFCFLPISSDLFSLFLKPEWQFAAPIAVILFAAYTFRPLLAILETLSLSQGEPKSGLKIQIIRVLTLVAFIPIYKLSSTPIHFAALTLIANILSAVICFTKLTGKSENAFRFTNKKWLLVASCVIPATSISFSYIATKTNGIITHSILAIAFPALFILILIYIEKVLGDNSSRNAISGLLK